MGGNNANVRGFGLTLEKIAEEKFSDGGSSPSILNEIKINHILLQLKRDFIDQFEQRIIDIDHKFD